MGVIFRFALPGAVLLALAACSTDETAGLEPLVCPVVGVLSDASSLRVFADGAGREQADVAANVAYELEFMRAHLLECELEKNRMTASIRFEARAQTGPAVRANEYAYPYFVALLDPGGKIVSKKIITARAKFKSGKTETFFAEEYDDIEFSVPEGKDGRGYEILTGFQLTREQMEFNRARRARPAENSPPDVSAQ